MGDCVVFPFAPQSLKPVQPAREMYIFYDMFRQNMVDYDFRVSKNMKVFEAKEVRDRKDTSQGHNFCFAVSSRSSIPMYVKCLSFFWDYINTTGAYVMLSGTVKKSTGISIGIVDLLIPSLSDFGMSQPI